MILLRRTLFSVLLVVGVTPAWAQVDTTKTARDTTAQRRDTTAQQPDTTKAAPAFADSVHPIPQMATVYNGPANGFTDGVWYFDRDAFLREAAVTVGDLLERIPGILHIRTGLFAQPEAISSAGGTAGRLEVWLDGYALNPMLEGSFDVSRLELAEIESVRVERRLGMVRVFIETGQARDSRVYSRIEAGVGQPNASMFRGVLQTPKLFVGPAGFAIDRIETNGSRGSEPADQLGGWAKWSYIRKGSGLQVEYRRAQTDRNPDSPWPEKFVRNDLMLRARGQIRPNLVVELFGGRSKATANLDSIHVTTDSVVALKLQDEDTQLGARASFDSPWFWASGSFRTHDAFSLPKTQIDAAGGVHYRMLSAGAELTQADWRAAGTATDVTLNAQIEPVKGIRVFGETTSSDRGASYLLRVPDSTAVITSIKSFRAGAEFSWHGITAGAALVHAKSDSVPSFGLPFDTINALFLGGDAHGWEVNGVVPIPKLKGFSVVGWMQDWRTGYVGLYMPTRQYRVGLQYYAIPLKSGNLELLGRLETVHRGAMRLPVRENPTGGQSVTNTTVLFDVIDAYVQIRIIDVRAFMRYEDLTGAKPFQVPGRQLPGPRIFYGVKWQFFN